MTETILKFGAIIIFCGLLIGSIGYLLFFSLSLLAEVKGFNALIVIIGTIYCLCGMINSIKRM